VIYKINDNLILEMTSEVLEKFNKYRQTGNRNEAGGILLGQVYNKRIVIDEITKPSFSDRAGRFFFIRNAKRAQKAVNTVWTQSAGKGAPVRSWGGRPGSSPRRTRRGPGPT